MPASFFVRDGDVLLPTDHCRGPWDEHACHAGPPTGLLARAMEQALPEQRLTRILVELLRPIPFAGLVASASVTRAGRTVSTSEALLSDVNGKPITRARGLHMREQTPRAYPSIQESMGHPDEAETGLFPIRETLHGKPAFNGSGVEVRYPAGETHEPGPTTAWLRTVPLIEGETPSAFQRMCPLADCGNAFGRNAEPQDVGFPNTDLTLVLHRDPDGEWLGTRSKAHWQESGIGLSEATLFDQHGAVGFALQTLLLLPSH